MSKFAKLKNVLKVGPTCTGAPTFTFNGGNATPPDNKTALYTLAVANFVSETTYYESTGNRDDRFVQLVHAVTAEDPEWVRGFVSWLRNSAQIRSASIVVAAEYARAKGTNARAVVGFACNRADEPAEMLGYWLGRYGRPLPMALKRGIADAAVRLYTQQAAVKWDSPRNQLRMADVLALTHPKPANDEQAQLFHYLLDKRHKQNDLHIGNAMDKIAEVHAFDAIPEVNRRDWLANNALPSLYTWERLSGWLPGGMDAQAWENAIPNMGYMALLRNLRNFEKAGVSDAVLNDVATKIADPAEVASSRQLPFRFYSAYKNSGSTRFAFAIEQALNASLANVPALSGRTLVAVDTSGSMQSPVSSRSQMLCVEAAAVFAAGIAAVSDVDLMIYADHGKVMNKLPLSALRTVDALMGAVGLVGHGTNTWPSVLKEYNGHDRIIVFTDMQDDPAAEAELPNVPVYVWDLRGYGKANIAAGAGRYLLGGLNDASFGLVSQLEQGAAARWPWSA